MANIKSWIKAAGIRAIKTVAQTAVASIGTGAIFAEVNWAAAVSASLLAGCYLCLLPWPGCPK